MDSIKAVVPFSLNAAALSVLNLFFHGYICGCSKEGYVCVAFHGSTHLCNGATKLVVNYELTCIGSANRILKVRSKYF